MKDTTGQRCHALENMFSPALAPRRKKAKVLKPMFPSPEAKAAWLASRKAEKATWVAASDEERQAYKSYLADCRDARVGLKSIVKFEEWRSPATTQGGTA